MNRVALTIIGAYIFVVDVTKTTMKVDIPGSWERYLLMLIVPIVVIRLFLLVFRERDLNRQIIWLKHISAGLLVSAVYYMIYREGDYKVLVFLAAFTIGTVGMEYRKILKAYAIAATTVILPAMLMAWTGAIENFVYFRDFTLRSSWGIKYPTDLTSLLFFLILALWIIFGKENTLWFLIPGVLLLILAQKVTDSRTGVLCSVALMIAIIIDYILTQKNAKSLSRATSICSCLAFPFFTVLMNALVLAYKSGRGFATKLDEIMSKRLSLSADAMNEHGIRMFGSKFTQIGWGGSTFNKPDYNFVDISYVYLLLAYGIVGLIMINILWVMMTRAAVVAGDRRLALALALIAFNSATEHHINQINYNIFLAVPFAVMAAKYTKQETTDSTERIVITDKEIGTTIKKVVLALSVLLLVALAIWVSLPAGRTIITLIDTNETVSGRRQLLIIYALITWLIIAATYACYKACKYFIMDNRKTAIKPWASILLIIAVACIAGTIRGHAIIKNGEKENDALIESERPVIETVLDAGRGKIYACGLPSIYRDKFKKISTSLFNGEELARYDDATIIIDKNTDSPSLFKKGFLYTQISDEHALFTKDEKVIEELSKGGQLFTGYFPLMMTVDMKDMAERNGLSQNSDGSITLHGEDEKLRKGPRIGLREGRYTIIFNLELEEPKATNGKDAICRLKTTYYKGEYILDETYVIDADFDEKGHCAASITCDIPDAANVDFKVLPEGNNVLRISGISYQKTPDYDVHTFYTSKGNKYREEYFDTEGLPYYGVGGYAVKEMAYDRSGNVINEKYYDEDNNSTVCNDGYHEIRREFNENNNVIKETFYGLNNEITSNASGYATTIFSYDSLGRMDELSYFDNKDNPAAVGDDSWGGFYRIKWTYDTEGRIIREDFLDKKGNPITIREGYSAREYMLDERGRRVVVTYYNQNNEKTEDREGCVEITRVFNKKDECVSEEYHGLSGEKVTLKGGYASVEFKYDGRKRVEEIDYFDIYGNPVMIGTDSGGGYQKIKRDYDNQNRVSAEHYFDKDGKRTMLSEGYASRKIIYKGNTKKVEGYIYYDINGNVIRSDRA